MNNMVFLRKRLLVTMLLIVAGMRCAWGQVEFKFEATATEEEAETEILKARVVEPKEEPKEINGMRILDIAEVMPSFPGGDGKMLEWLSKNVRYPAIAEENKVQGRVIVKFAVGPDGSIHATKILRSVDPALDKEALRVVKAMPQWIPGKRNGVAVAVWFTLPVTFQLNDPTPQIKQKK